MGLRKKLNSLRIALSLGFASADKLILKDDSSKAPENTNIVSQNFSRHDFVRSIQKGKFTEHQLKMFYKLLDRFDDSHGRVDLIKIKEGYYDEDGEWIEPEFHNFMITMQQHEQGKSLLGDKEPGYSTILFLANKDMQIEDISLHAIKEFAGTNGKELDDAINEHTKWMSTLTIQRDYMTYGVPLIENYANEIFVKVKHNQDLENDKSCLVEFYCFNFNKKKVQVDSRDGYMGLVKENLYENLNKGFTLSHFTNFQGFKIYEQSATRNDIPHEFIVKEYKSIKELDKGFVVKFLCEKL